tara:strand:+ start:32 stop:640 length:609 start_codon:yes stop_codon:yes gene_type:complete
MKLLLENWRQYMLFENIESAVRLSIFDFDETIAFSEGFINVTSKETGKKFQISSQEKYDELKADGGYEFDFSPLDNVHNAVENPSITSILRDRLKDPNTQVIVLTARAPISIDDIHRVLQTFDNPIETDNIIMIGNEGGNKGEYVRDVILSKYANIKVVEFFDDSQQNIIDMKAAKNEASESGRIEKFDIYHVSDGIPKIVS